MKKLLNTTITIILFLISPEANALPKFEIEKGTDLELYQQVQVWNLTTISPTSGINARNDTFIRRGRLGTRGHFYKNTFFYNILMDYDNLGKDGKTRTIGSAQSTDNSLFRIHEALFTYEPEPKFNLTFGYFRPQIGRESLSSDFEDYVFEKPYTSSYVRTHLVGRGTGRETGVNVGGLHLANMWSINYNLGFFDTNHEKLTGGTTDSKNGSNIWSPLVAGRVAISIGAPELEKYKLGANVNYFGKRNGITLAANYSYQGNTDIQKDNNLLGFDILANYQDFNLSSEYDILGRTKSDGANYIDQLFHTKLSYNIHLSEEYILEPALMYSLALISPKSTIGLPSESMFDFGINWYMNKNNIKFNTHFIQKTELNDSKKNTYLIGIGSQFLY